jgi:predicted DCC family thiol-disulfide oxidoreductase YuxK
LQTENSHIPQPLLLYDGYCALCNNIVKLILNSASKHVFYFSPLQGNTAKSIAGLDTHADSVVLLYNGTLYYKAQAAFMVIKLLQNIWYKPLLIFSFMPPFYANFLYTVIAKSRYRIWGKLNTCPLPPEKFLHRFLP